MCMTPLPSATGRRLSPQALETCGVEGPAEGAAAFAVASSRDRWRCAEAAPRRPGPIRIAVFSTLFPPNVVGGAEKTVEILMLGLAGQGAEVHVITTDPEEDRSGREGLLHVHRVRLRNLYWPHLGTKRRPVWQRALWHALDVYNAPMGRVADRLLDAIRPDIVLTFNIQGFSTAVWRAAFRHRRPVVHVIQDYWLLCPRTTMFKDGCNCGPSCTSCRLLTLPRRHLTDRVDAVVGISRAVLDQHKAEGLFARVGIQKVIHNARRMAAGRGDGEASRRGPLRIGFFGRVSREKGFELLLDELAAMGQEDWLLLVGGRCPTSYVADLRRRRALDRVSFLGFVEPEWFFGQIDLLVVPSLWREPLGSVAIEAMGSGIPVIVSARGGLPEVVGDAGGGGLVFDPGEPGSLRRCLSPFVRVPGLTSSLRPEMLGRTRHFTVQRQVASYARLLEEVLAARAPSPPAEGGARSPPGPPGPRIGNIWMDTWGKRHGDEHR